MKRTVGIEPTTYRLIEFAVCIPKLAEGTGFEPVITISKTGALGQTKLTPNNLVYFLLNHIVWHF